MEFDNLKKSYNNRFNQTKFKSLKYIRSTSEVQLGNKLIWEHSWLLDLIYLIVSITIEQL